jgi:hypothetical protein
MLGGVREASHGVRVHAQLTGDRAAGQATAHQFLHQCVAQPRADGQALLGPWLGC